jgi:hypothetical protein
MSATAWVILLFVGLPLIGFLVWLLFDESYVRIEPGRLGLLMVKGRATDKVLLPGPHWVPSLRRMSVVEYPSLELSYRADDLASASQTGDQQASAPVDDLEYAGPAVSVTLGDRAAAVVSYTVRFRLLSERLRWIHERFGPNGLWAIARDEGNRTVADALSNASCGVDDLFGDSRAALEEKLAAAMHDALGRHGFEVTMFSLGNVDLGRLGEVIQGAVRARYEREREEADATTRLARARHDAELAPHLAGISVDAALRYREADLWREIALRPDRLSLVLPRPPSAGTGSAAASINEVTEEPSEPSTEELS